MFYCNLWFFYLKEGSSLHLMLNFVFSVKFKTLWMTDCMCHHQHASSCVQIIEEGRKYVKRIFLMIFLLLIVWRNKFIKCRFFLPFRWMNIIEYLIFILWFPETHSVHDGSCKSKRNKKCVTFVMMDKINWQIHHFDVWSK